MCVSELFIDRYPDGSEVHFRQTRLCRFGVPGRVCESSTTLTNTPREIQYGEPTSEFILTQSHTPRSSSSSQRPPLVEIMEERPSSRDRKNRGSLLLSAFFGASPRRRKSQKDRVMFVDSPPGREGLRTPSPIYSRPLTPLSPSPLSYGESSPRGRPVIIEDHRRPERTTSIEVVIGDRVPRSQSPTIADLRRQDEEREAERCRRRDERAARLAAEVREERQRREREHLRALHDAEIMARPAVASRPRPVIRTVIDQSMRLNDALADTSLATRGKRVIAQAEAQRRAEEDRAAWQILEDRRRRDAARMARANQEAKDELDQQHRLRRRFTIGTARPRHRVLYDDGAFRYE